MKFSVLLPTRNRLKYLKYAVASVLAQNYDQWEIIISDNDSEDNIAQYIESLNDARIKYFRTEKFVSVTENWNNALSYSSGEYVIMLGDDDILLRDYFSTMIGLLQKFNQPSVIYANAYIYAYPGVIRNKPEGLLQTCRHYDVFNNATEPFWLTKKMAMHLVTGHLNFNAYFGTNMQFVLVKQSLIQKLKVRGQFFHAPYPDVYAMNLLMLEADEVLVYPDEAVVIGVTPKSTGNFLVNNNENKGMDFLNISDELASIKELSSKILPGSPNLTCWLISMETVRLYFEKKFDLKVHYRRYRFLQIEQMIKGFFLEKKATTKNELFSLFKQNHLSEKIIYFIPLFFIHFIKKFFPSFIKKWFYPMYSRMYALSKIKGSGIIEKKFLNVLEIFENHENGKIYSNDQIDNILNENRSEKDINEVCKTHGISQATFHRWKSKRDSSISEQIRMLKTQIDALQELTLSMSLKETK